MRVLHPSVDRSISTHGSSSGSSRELQPTLLVMNMQMVASVTVTALITINRLLCQLCQGMYSCPASTMTRARFYCIVDRPRLISFRSRCTPWLFFFPSCASILTACQNNYERNDWNNVAIKVVRLTLPLSLKQFKKVYALCILNNSAVVSIEFKCNNSTLITLNYTLIDPR